MQLGHCVVMKTDPSLSPNRLYKITVHQNKGQKALLNFSAAVNLPPGQEPVVRAQFEAHYAGVKGNITVTEHDILSWT